MSHNEQLSNGVHEYRTIIHSWHSWHWRLGGFSAFRVAFFGAYTYIHIASKERKEGKEGRMWLVLRNEYIEKYIKFPDHPPRLCDQLRFVSGSGWVLWTLDGRYLSAGFNAMTKKDFIPCLAFLLR